MTYDTEHARPRALPLALAALVVALLLAAWLWSFRAGRAVHETVPQPGEVVPGAPPPATSQVPGRAAPAGASPSPGGGAVPPR